MISVDYCNPSQVFVTVPHMYVPGTGGIAQPPLQEVRYDWTIPSGWKDNSTGQTGNVVTTVNGIVLVPTKCAVTATGHCQRDHK